MAASSLPSPRLPSLRVGSSRPIEALHGTTQDVWETGEIQALKNEVDALRRSNAELQKQLEAKPPRDTSNCYSGPRPEYTLLSRSCGSSPRCASESRSGPTPASTEPAPEPELGAVFAREKADFEARLHAEERKCADAERHLSELQGQQASAQLQMESLLWERRAGATDVAWQRDQVELLRARLTELRAGRAARLAELYHKGERLDGCTHNIEVARSDLRAVSEDHAILTEKKQTVLAQLRLLQQKMETSMQELHRRRHEFDGEVDRCAAVKAQLSTEVEEATETSELAQARLKAVEASLETCKTETLEYRGSLARVRCEYDELLTHRQELARQRDHQLHTQKTAHASAQASQSSVSSRLSVLEEQLQEQNRRAAENEAQHSLLLDVLSKEQTRGKLLTDDLQQKLEIASNHIKALEQQLTEEQTLGDQLTADMFAASAAAARHSATPRGSASMGKRQAARGTTPKRWADNNYLNEKGSPALPSWASRDRRTAPSPSPSVAARGRTSSVPATRRPAASSSSAAAGLCKHCNGFAKATALPTGSAAVPRSPSSGSRCGRCVYCGSRSRQQSQTAKPNVHSEAQKPSPALSREVFAPIARQPIGAAPRLALHHSPAVSSTDSKASVALQWAPLCKELDHEVKQLREWKRQAATSVERMAASLEAARVGYARQVQYGQALQMACDQLSRRASEVVVSSP